jgi:hypothetical protein
LNPGKDFARFGLKTTPNAQVLQIGRNFAIFMPKQNLAVQEQMYRHILYRNSKCLNPYGKYKH